MYRVGYFGLNTDHEHGELISSVGGGEQCMSLPDIPFKVQTDRRGTSHLTFNLTRSSHVIISLVCTISDNPTGHPFLFPFFFFLLDREIIPNALLTIDYCMVGFFIHHGNSHSMNHSRNTTPRVHTQLSCAMSANLNYLTIKRMKT